VQFGMGIIAAALLAIGRWITKQVQDQKAFKNGLKALLRNEIYNHHDRCVEKGYCPLWQRENVSEMFAQYKALGGNGTVPNLVEELHDMPTKEKKNKEEKQ